MNINNVTDIILITWITIIYVQLIFILINLSLSNPSMYNPFHSTPLSSNKSHIYSPDQHKTPISTSSISKSPIKPNHSPNKTNISPYTIHNQQKLKVFIKFKPPAIYPQFLNIAYVNQKQIEIQRQSSNNKIIYSYDRVFHQNVSSSRVFAQGCMDVIDQMIAQGQNGLIFVYGHTGTGKTYTMGLLDYVDQNNTGIVPESLRYILKIKNKFQQKYSKSTNNKIQISLSFNQIYMDQVYDMLDFQSDAKLIIRQNQQTKQPFIQNNIAISINTIQEAYQLLNIGLEKRRVGQQKCNKRSSRGHGLITVIITMSNGKVCRLCFVDLAGSQRVKQSESIGKTLKEAVYINTSLSALQALLMNIDQQSVRMYRGNKLTRLLQPFMQSGKIRLFVTSNYQNIQPIQFAKRCKGIKFMQKQLIQQIPRQSHSPTPKRKPQSTKSNINTKQYQKLKQQNKYLRQSLTSTMVILNKINKIVINLIDQQNVHSLFSLSNNFNLSVFNLHQEIQAKINEKINQLEVQQADILQKCSSIIQTNKDKQKDKDKDDSINTSVSNNQIKPDKISSQLQTLMTYATTQIDKFTSKLNQLGFGIFHTVKQLASLCQYRNIYKKQMFTYAIKQQILENKNHQLQNAINCLLKHCKASQHGSGYNKILKELKQIGIELNSIKNTNKTRQNSSASNLNQPYSTSNSNLKITTKIDLGKSELSTSPNRLSEGLSMPVNLSTMQKNKKQQDLQQNMKEQDDGQLFSTTYQNNVNSNNRISMAKTNDNLNKKTNKNKVGQRKSLSHYMKTNTDKSTNNITGQTLHKNAKRAGGLILIQDL